MVDGTAACKGTRGPGICLSLQARAAGGISHQMQPLCVPSVAQLHPPRWEWGAPCGFRAIGRVEMSSLEAQPLLRRVLRVSVVVLATAELGERQVLPPQSQAPPLQQPGTPKGSSPRCLSLPLTVNVRLGTESSLLISPEQPSDGAKRGATL